MFRTLQLKAYSEPFKHLRLCVSCAVNDSKSITVYEKKPIFYAYKIAPNNFLCQNITQSEHYNYHDR